MVLVIVLVDVEVRVEEVVEVLAVDVQMGFGEVVVLVGSPTLVDVRVEVSTWT